MGGTLVDTSAVDEKNCHSGVLVLAPSASSTRVIILCIDISMDVSMDGSMDQCMDRCINVWIDVSMYQWMD